MSKYEDDNPIQEYTRESIFAKIKKFEKDDDQYELQREKKNYINTSLKNEKKEFPNYYPRTKYNNSNSNIGPEAKIILFCFLGFFIFCCSLPIMFEMSFLEMMTDFENGMPKDPMPFETSLGSENPELNDEFDNIGISELEFIEFNNAGKIPALYKFDKYTIANWCDFTELDSRFTFNVNTIQINYDNIPQLSKYKLTQGLENRHYELVNNYPTGDLYAINTANGYFMFVLISSNDIIYGAAQGNYEGVFNVIEK